MTLSMPPDIVIRPSGVWNSRAPFHSYLPRYKRLNRVNSIAILSAERVGRDVTSASGTLRPLFVPKQRRSPTEPKRRAEGRLNTAWSYYKVALDDQPEAGGSRQPTAAEVCEDLEEMVVAVRQATLLLHVSLFESYLQCWTLNYLLAKLENATLWTNEDRFLATKLSPVHSSGSGPGLSTVLRCIPELRSGLRGIPPYFRAPSTGQLLTAPTDPKVNALDTVQFWIDLRNVLVHSDGLPSPSFCTRHESFWKAAYQGLPYVDALIPFRHLKIPVPLLMIATLAFYRAALWMSDFLEVLSFQRRGHPFAPSPKPPGRWAVVPQRPPAMLLPGDHSSSYSWASDDSFRERFMKEYSH